MLGTVTISLEIELAWGVIRSHPEKVDERFSADRRRETETLDRLLTLCDDLDIPVNFDVVGHLLLDSCSGRHDGPHPAQVFFRTPTVEEPTLVDGLVETYTSWHTSLSAPHLPKGQAPPHPLYRSILRSIRRRHHQRFLARGLREAAARESSVHYWSHLFDISNDAQWPAVRSFLDLLATARNRGRVQIETMDTLGERIK